MEVPSQAERPHRGEPVLLAVGRRSRRAVGNVGEVPVPEVDVAAGEEADLCQQRLGSAREV